MPGQQIQKGTTYVNYPTVGTSQVTAENLNDHVDNAVLLPGAVSAQFEDTPQDVDYVLAERGGSLFKYTLSAIKDLFATYFPLRSGSSMTGELTLSSSTPSAASVAASKGYVDSVITASVLSGSIVMWGGSSAPTGWLECNGQSTAGWPNLISIYGTNVPDLRGEFVRGWDHGKGTDFNRGIRSFQNQDFLSHTHSPPGGYQWVTTPFSGDGSIDSSGRTGDGERNGVSLPSTAAGGSETRPRNIALMFIVKT